MRRRPGPDQLAKILREIQADLEAGLNVHQACRKAGYATTTYYRWKALQEDPVTLLSAHLAGIISELPLS